MCDDGKLNSNLSPGARGRSARGARRRPPASRSVAHRRRCNDSTATARAMRRAGRADAPRLAMEGRHPGGAVDRRPMWQAGGLSAAEETHRDGRVQAMTSSPDVRAVGAHSLFVRQLGSNHRKRRRRAVICFSRKWHTQGSDRSDGVVIWESAAMQARDKASWGCCAPCGILSPRRHLARRSPDVRLDRDGHAQGTRR